MYKMESFEALQVLIEELSKDKSNQTRVRKLMESSGLEYTPDSIQQMSAVLVLISKITLDTRRIKTKEKVRDL